MKRVLIVDDIASWRKFNTEAVIQILGKDIVIETADCASNAYNLLLENNSTPFDIILTDLQMENDYLPKYAGEWLVEQIKTLPNYYKTKIIIISASLYAKIVAKNNNVDYILKLSQLNNIAQLEEYIKY